MYSSGSHQAVIRQLSDSDCSVFSNLQVCAAFEAKNLFSLVKTSLFISEDFRAQVKDRYKTFGRGYIAKDFHFDDEHRKNVSLI